MILSEGWMPIKNYEGYYEINRNGLVRSVQRKVAKGKTSRSVQERILKQRLNNYGYAEVRLSKEGITKTRFVHTLIANGFIPNPGNRPEVNHKNGVKSDNRIENLEWVTHSENMKHAYKIGLIKQKGKLVIDKCSGKEYANTRIAAMENGINYYTLRSRLTSKTKKIDTCLQYKYAA